MHGCQALPFSKVLKPGVVVGWLGRLHFRCTASSGLPPAWQLLGKPRRPAHGPNPWHPVSGNRGNTGSFGIATACTEGGSGPDSIDKNAKAGSIAPHLVLWCWRFYQPCGYGSLAFQMKSPCSLCRNCRRHPGFAFNNTLTEA